jgi:hypothetical protein
LDGRAGNFLLGLALFPQGRDFLEAPVIFFGVVGLLRAQLRVGGHKLSVPVLQLAAAVFQKLRFAEPWGRKAKEGEGG